MKKIFLALTFIFFLSFGSSVFAEDTNQQYFCLASTPHQGDVHGADITLDPVKSGAATAGNKMYVLVRIDNLLTTGDPSLDDKIFGGTHTNYNTLNTTVGFGKHGNTGLVPATANPVADPKNPPLNVYWHDDLDLGVGREHYWFGMQIGNPAAQANNGGNGGVQNGTFAWAADPKNKDCAWIGWDPLGYVFDAKTLGAIPGASVTVYNADLKPPLPLPTGTGVGFVQNNPYLTGANGIFSIFTPEGNYMLKVTGSYKGQPLVIEDFAAINKGFKNQGYYNLYNLKGVDSVFHEAAGQTVRTDIAVKTVGAPAPTPIIAPPNIIDLNFTGADSSMIVSGKIDPYLPEVSPMKVVPIYIDPTTQQSLNGDPILPNNPNDPTSISGIDANGRFRVIIDQVKIDEVNKKSYFIDRLALLGLNETTAQNKGFFGTFIGFFTKIKDSFTVHAAQTNITVNPIPSFLEGITQDSKGKVASSALVGIYIKGSNAPAYQTKSDINGHYVIGSQFIPMLPYDIRITLVTGEVIPLTTMQYLKQNAAYLKQNNINSFATVQTNSSIDSTGTLMITKTVITPIPSTRGTSNNGSGGGVGSNSTRNATSPTTPVNGISTSGMQGVIMVVVALLMLVMIGVGAFIVMKSKQQVPPQY